MKTDYLHQVLLRPRTKGSRLSLLVAAFFFVLSFLVFFVNPGHLKITDDTRLPVFLGLLLGSLLTLSTLFYVLPFADAFFPLFSLVAYAVALGRELELFAYPIADKVTGVNWFGGSFPVYCTFFVLIAAGTIAAIVALFLPQREEEK